MPDFGPLIRSRLRDSGLFPAHEAELGATALSLVVVALSASLVPAARAARLDPIVALRVEE